MLQTTPTESAILAVVNAAFVGLFVYQEIRWSRSAEVTGAVCFCWVWKEPWRGFSRRTRDGRQAHARRQRRDLHSNCE